MDRLTRNAILLSALLLLLLILSLAWNQFGITPRIWQLNALLKEDPVLADYPYDFRAVLFFNGIATLTNPTAGSVPAEPFLTRIDPELTGQAPDDDLMGVARERFRRHEMRAIELMVSQPDVESVVWSLDRAWYHKHGIPLGRP